MSILAEMENVRRIDKNDVEKANTYSIQKFAKSLLSTSDNLARAIEAVEKEDGLADATPALLSLHEGVVMTEKEFELKEYAFRRKPSSDPNRQWWKEEGDYLDMEKT